MTFGLARGKIYTREREDMRRRKKRQQQVRSATHVVACVVYIDGGQFVLASTKTRLNGDDKLGTRERERVVLVKRTKCRTIKSG